MPGTPQPRVSFTNWWPVAGAGALSTNAAHVAGWPLTNVLYPQQPRVLAKTTDRSGDKDYASAFGTSRTVELVMAVNINYSTFNVYDTPLTFFATATTQWNPWARMYCAAYVFSPAKTVSTLTFRIPSTATVLDGAAGWSTGGFWAGPLTALPTDLRWDEVPHIHEPRITRELIGGGTSTVITGYPWVETRARRLAAVTHATPATGDQLGAWLNVDYLFQYYGFCAWFANRGNSGEAYIFKKMNESRWPVNPVVSEDDLVLEQLVGP